ncbi:MAG: hypothetical protein LBM01_02845 [Christensenellaceae bacterium]|jgi:hypothetical protein|nr:hypothetical protein [Christensenellaceae bacterium]
MPTATEQNVAIQVQRILDSCIKREKDGNAVLVLDAIPPDSVPPYTFISATQSGEGVITNLTINPISGRQSYSDIAITATTPLTVTLRDANGKIVTTTSGITQTKSTVMYYPTDALTQPGVKIISAVQILSGTFLQNGTIISAACKALTTKVVVDTALVVPAFGILAVPNSVDYESQLCAEFFNLPLTPRGKC